MKPVQVNSKGCERQCGVQDVRNEIRSLLKVMGTPALFITLNPSDLRNPLVSVLDGFTVNKWNHMMSAETVVFVAVDKIYRSDRIMLMLFDFTSRLCLLIDLQCSRHHQAFG